jgi:hypothetical protein
MGVPAAYRAVVLGDTLEAMRAAALGANDGGGYFPAMYARVTQRVIDDAEAGRFADDARMAAFVVEFANRYWDARADPSSAARCWRGSFDVAGDPALLIVQHLLLGINAHVNFDLPQAVVRLVDGGAELDGIRPDFEAVNGILAATYDDIMSDLDRVTRWTSKAGASGGGWIFNFSLRAAREQAWRASVRLAGETEPARRDDLALLDDLVAVLAFLVTRPKPPVRWLVPLLRRLETRDPDRVIRALLGPLA